jgi:crotonobetainyl-CoA:carnitine CoA-transferase CaiB-like acyl-CoA transferase
MSEQHAALLKKARERLVENRRNFAKIIAAPFEREKTNDARERFIEMQMAIEAVDRAIKDEEADNPTGC